MVKTENLDSIKENNLSQRGLVPLDTSKKEFEMLISLYKLANEDILEKINIIKDYLKLTFEYDVINHVKSRIKTPTSIINKMKMKKYNLTYENLIENINDIAGIRIICTFKSDIEKVLKIIRKIPNTRIINEKDYILHPKKSGYSGYHIILEDFIKYEEEYIPVKVEIQLRTMAMDFWSEAEHKVKYKPKSKVSAKDSKKLEWYAKIINIIDDKITKIYQKQIN